jgi:RNA polymerase sigma-70 factor (ECF subfamily)
MNSPEEIFGAQRSRLFGIAYRMLGSRADAEDALQDAYIRWRGSEPSELHNPQAWLATIVTRLCIDRLRAAKTERETYTGSWLPEPLLSPRPASPDRTAELASDISVAFLTVLERLAVEERAAFLLHEVFDFDYSEIAQIIGKSQVSCRQIVHRAKRRVQEDRPRFTVNQQTHTQLVEKFMAAASLGSREQITALIAEDVRVTVDGGGKVSAFRKVLQGSDSVARLYAGLRRKFGERMSYRLAEINGEAGLLQYTNDKLESVHTFVSDGTRIIDVYVVRNPEKLKNLFTAA